MYAQFCNQIHGTIKPLDKTVRRQAIKKGPPIPPIYYSPIADNSPGKISIDIIAYKPLWSICDVMR